jgi:hypothetical protein
MFLPRPLALLCSQVMTTLVSPSTYTFNTTFINTITTLIILFVPTYDGSTPDSTLDGEGQLMPAYDDLNFDSLEYLCSVPCTGMQVELGGLQLRGAPTTGTQEGGGTQLSSGGWLEVATRGAGSSHPVAGSTHTVAGSTATATMTTTPADDAMRRQIHPHDQLTYPRDQTWVVARAARQQQKKRRC